MIQGVAPQSPASLGSAVSARNSELLKSFGFDPGIPVYDIVKLEFDIEDVKRALFHSDYSLPITLSFRAMHADSTTPTGIDLLMAVELVQASYESYEKEIDGVGINRYESPEYYLRGFLQTRDADREAVRMHAYLRVGARNELDSATVQIVTKPSGADPAATLHYGA